MSNIFASCGHGSGASTSASVLPKNINGCFPLGLTCLILQLLPDHIAFKLSVNIPRMKSGMDLDLFALGFPEP